MLPAYVARVYIVCRCDVIMLCCPAERRDTVVAEVHRCSVFLLSACSSSGQEPMLELQQRASAVEGAATLVVSGGRAGNRPLTTRAGSFRIGLLALRSNTPFALVSSSSYLSPPLP